MTTDGEGRGVFTQISFTGTYSGWLCVYDSAATAPDSASSEVDYTVVCNAHYLTSITAPAPIIDDSTVISSDSWICEAQLVDSSDGTQIVECVNYLPTESMDGYSTGLYRWSPYDGLVEQYGYRLSDASTAEWIKLGMVTINGAR